MLAHHHEDNILQQISEFAVDAGEFDSSVLDAACLSMLDAIGCACAAMAYPACTKLLGPVVPGTVVPNGCRIPGTRYQLDPVEGAFNFGAALRWLDYNDTWLAKEWGHPSDNLAAILPLADYLCRAGADQSSTTQPTSGGQHGPTMLDVLDAMVRAYEIQGVLSLGNSLNQSGVDHVVFVKVASAATASRLLGATRQQTTNAVSQAFADGGTLRAYRHAPNTGSRKSWAAGDAASRGVKFAMMSVRDEEGYPTILSAEKWGFQDVVLGGQKLNLPRPLQAYITPRVLLKVRYPAEFHAQTALEAAISLHASVAHRWREIKKIVIHTHASAIRIIDKQGPLRNPADRDHCLQYITIVGLLKGNLTAQDYEDSVHESDMRIDSLRARTVVQEDEQYSEDYLNLDKRSVANRVTVVLEDGSTFESAVEYPLGHERRRTEAAPWLRKKFVVNLSTVFGLEQAEEICQRVWDDQTWYGWSVARFVNLFLP